MRGRHCGFGRYDDNGAALFECSEKVVDEYPMADGGTVLLCAKHRRWFATLAPSDTTGNIANEADRSDRLGPVAPPDPTL